MFPQERQEQLWSILRSNPILERLCSNVATESMSNLNGALTAMYLTTGSPQMFFHASLVALTTNIAVGQLKQRTSSLYAVWELHTGKALTECLLKVWLLNGLKWDAYVVEVESLCLVHKLLFWFSQHHGASKYFYAVQMFQLRRLATAPDKIIPCRTG